LEEIEQLVGAIFRIAIRKPEVYLEGMMREEAKKYLKRDNRVFG